MRFPIVEGAPSRIDVSAMEEEEMVAYALDHGASISIRSTATTGRTCGGALPFRMADFFGFEVFRLPLGQLWGDGGDLWGAVETLPSGPFRLLPLP